MPKQTQNNNNGSWSTTGILLALSAGAVYYLYNKNKRRKRVTKETERRKLERDEKEGIKVGQEIPETAQIEGLRTHYRQDATHQTSQVEGCKVPCRQKENNVDVREDQIIAQQNIFTTTITTTTTTTTTKTKLSYRDSDINEEISSSVNQPRACSREQYLQVLKDQVQTIEETIKNLAFEEENLRSRNEPHDKIMEKLNKSYHSIVSKAMKQSFKRNKTTDESYRLADEKYNDNEIMEYRSKKQKIEAALRGDQIELTEEQLAQIPKHFTIEKIIELFKEFGSQLRESHNRTMKEIEVKLGNNNTEEFKQMCTSKNLIEDEKIRTNIFKKYKIEEKILDLAMQRHMHDPRLQQTMVEIQE